MEKKMKWRRDKMLERTKKKADAISISAVGACQSFCTWAHVRVIDITHFLCSAALAPALVQISPWSYGDLTQAQDDDCRAEKQGKPRAYGRAH